MCSSCITITRMTTIFTSFFSTVLKAKFTPCWKKRVGSARKVRRNTCVSVLQPSITSIALIHRSFIEISNRKTFCLMSMESSSSLTSAGLTTLMTTIGGWRIVEHQNTWLPRWSSSQATIKLLMSGIWESCFSNYWPAVHPSKANLSRNFSTTFLLWKSGGLRASMALPKIWSQNYWRLNLSTVCLSERSWTTHGSNLCRNCDLS